LTQTRARWTSLVTHAVTGRRESRAGAAGKTAVKGNLRLGWGKIAAESETFKGGGRLFAHSSLASCKCDKKLAELLSFQLSNEHASHKRRATLSWVRLGTPGSQPGYTVPSSKRCAVRSATKHRFERCRPPRRPIRGVSFRLLVERRTKSMRARSLEGWQPPEQSADRRAAWMR
jgi:hypothetical protein